MLYQEILEELEKLGAGNRTVDLVLAALAGEQSVEGVLEGGTAAVSTRGETGADEPNRSVYLQDITVSGFRGIGPEANLEIPAGPGLTVVTGRNGSGKSSFAEALEVLLTGDTLRWAEKKGPWKEGWKNLHHSSGPRITARFQAEGKRGLTTVDCVWSEGSDFAGAERTAQHHGERRTDLAGIGWETPLDLYRPLLSYNELGMVGAGPSALFDTLAAVLGLDPLVDARKPLSAARLKREKFDKQVKAERLSLLAALESIEDQRAAVAASALRKRNWDLDAITRVGTEPGSEQRPLRDLATLEIPEQEKVLEIAGELEAAYSDLSGLIGTEAEQAEHLVQLLQRALEHHSQHGDEPCPVCGVGTMDADWRTSTERQVARLGDSARRYQEAKGRLKRAVDAARALVAFPAIPRSASVDTSGLRAVRERWGSLPDQPDEIPDHLLEVHEELVRETTKVSEQAGALYSEREERWKEVSPGLMTWVDRARRAVGSREAVKQIRKAEAARKQVTESLRNARWAPIEAKALALWKDLRLQSNVDLRSVQLAGSGTRRHVSLTVDVDGTVAPALAVVSQGELSCLALSLFFPRAMLVDSPFRFLVIDDPVQAMDPARVDGLARVFARIAQNRQLVVFTHDDRLPESLRRMKIEHTCKKVTRRPESSVEVLDSHDPVKQYFIDARTVINDEALPEKLAKRVIPGICRNGLEAACIEAVRRRKLTRGEAHAEVESVLEAAQRLIQKVALVLFDDMRKGGDVSGRIRRRWGASFENAFWGANRGTHGPYNGNLSQLIYDCQELAMRLRSQ